MRAPEDVSRDLAEALFQLKAGTTYWGFYPKFSRDIARRRVKEAEEVKAEILLTDCLSCKHNLKQGVPFEGKLRVLTTPEYLLEGIETGKIRFSKKP